MLGVSTERWECINWVEKGETVSPGRRICVKDLDGRFEDWKEGSCGYGTASLERMGSLKLGGREGPGSSGTADHMMQPVSVSRAVGIHWREIDRNPPTYLKKPKNGKWDPCLYFIPTFLSISIDYQFGLASVTEHAQNQKEKKHLKNIVNLVISFK